MLSQLIFGPRDIGGGYAETIVEHATEFREIDFPGEKLVLRQYQPEKLCAQSAGCEGANKNVGVEKNSQEMSRKTSSSVT